MATTTHLGMVLLETSQAQKEVTVNEALARLDAILNAGVKDKDLATPPASPSAGDVYIVAASPTGAWAGKALAIAYFDQIWRFITPNAGIMLWVIDEAKHYVFNGTSWQAIVMNADMTKTVYDSAAISEQLVGISAAQTLANKTLSSPVINGTLSGTAIGTSGAVMPLLSGANTWSAEQSISANSSSAALKVTQTGAGDALVVEDASNDSSAFIIDANGRIKAGGITTALATDGMLQLNVPGSTTGAITTNVGTSSARTHIRLAASDAEVGGIGTSAGAMTFAVAGTTRLSIASDGGITVGSPTGGSKGAGTLNATAVYDDNTLLTCYVGQAFREGVVDTAYWDQFAPEIAGTRVHQAARGFAQVAADRLDTEKFCQFFKDTGRLPAFPAPDKWQEAFEGKMAMGDLVQRLWETVEVLSVHIAKLHARTKALEEA